MVQSFALPQPGEVVGRKYRIVSRIGAGGMGVVLEAINVDTEGRVALKWLNPELSSSPEAVERFKLEARATGRIRHPNVVAIHDIGEHEGHLYLVMEFLMGAPLRTRIAQGPLDVYEACRILFPVMRGVSAAHAVKILHRDIKPDNIFLAESPDGLESVPKVLDFGIAKLCSDSERTGSASARTAMMGTYQYMALEQLHGRRDLDERVDVYALGAVLYNMLTGRLPYQADNPVDLALQMLQGPPAPVTAYAPSVPPGMAEVLARALSRERDQRYTNVEQFAFDLEPYAQGTRYKGQGSRPIQSQVANATSEGPASVPPLRTPFQVSNTGPLAQPVPNTPPLRSPNAGRAVTPLPNTQPVRSSLNTDEGPATRARRASKGSSFLVYAAALLIVGLGGGTAWKLWGPGATDGPSGTPSASSGNAAVNAPPPPPTAPISPGLTDPNGQPNHADSDWAASEPTTPNAIPAQQPLPVDPAPLPQEKAPLAPSAQAVEPPQWPNADGQWPSATAKPDAGVSAAGRPRERRRPHHADTTSSAPQESAKPAKDDRDNSGLGNYGGGLDMTELPAPSWAADPKR